jgi:hypothetical protein
VLEVAAAGDPVAHDVVETGVDGLAMLAAAAVRHADLDWRDMPVAAGGGVLLGAAAVAERLAQRLRSLGASQPRLLDVRAAARGAASLAQAWHERRSPQCEWVEHVAL